MMPDYVLTRQAVRKFKPDELTDAEISQLVAAFNAAPCGMHQIEDMRGVVVKDSALRAKIETACDHACYDAPLLFVITTKKESNFGERDASVAAENIMIEANSIGLGSVYVMGGALTIENNTELKKELGIDPAYEIQVIVSVGYASGKNPKEDRANRYQVEIK